MRIATAILIAIIAVAGRGAVVVHAEEPSIKEGFKELGHGIEHDTKKGLEASKRATKEAWDAAKRGTGTALQKTGEGLNKAGGAVEGAGSDVKEESK
jgi:hypothetical protein